MSDFGRWRSAPILDVENRINGLIRQVPGVYEENRLAFCSKCGKELTPDAAYCIHCGARAGATPFQDRWDWRWERPRHERRRGGWIGVVNAFGILTILGLTISQYPDVFLLIGRYLGSWGAHGYPVLPGDALGRVIVYFFTACGVWGLIVAALRFAFTDAFSRPMRDIVGALFALYIAGSFSQFYSGAIRGSGLVLALIMGLAFVIVANAVIAFFLPHRIWRQTSESN